MKDLFVVKVEEHFSCACCLKSFLIRSQFYLTWSWWLLGGLKARSKVLSSGAAKGPFRLALGGSGAMARGAKVCGALLGHKEGAGGRHLAPWYAMEGLAGLHVVVCGFFGLFLCFPPVVSIKLHCKGWFVFFSTRFWFALQIQCQSKTWAASSW